MGRAARSPLSAVGGPKRWSLREALVSNLSALASFIVGATIDVNGGPLMD